MTNIRRVAITAVGIALLAAAVPMPAHADWRGRGGYGPRYYGGYGGGGWHHHHGAPVWPWVAGGLLGLGVLGALTAPPVYTPPPPVYYPPPPVYYAPPPAYYPQPWAYAPPPPPVDYAPPARMVRLA
jgi:hypothetical protein